MRVTAEGPGSPAPNLLNACTANVYEAPSESPDTRQVKVVVAQERPPGLAFTMYFVTINPPVDTGGCHATDQRQIRILERGNLIARYVQIFKKISLPCHQKAC